MAILTVADAKSWIEKYFEQIPAAQLPAKPDLTEPVQEKEKRFTKEDKLAKKPAIAIAYKMPESNTPEYYAMGLIDQMLVQGQDSKLYNLLVQKKGIPANVSGGINIGWEICMITMDRCFGYPTSTYDSTITSDSIIRQYDVAIDDIAKNVTAEDLQLAIVKISQVFMMPWVEILVLERSTCWLALLCLMIIHQRSIPWKMNSKK